MRLYTRYLPLRRRRGPRAAFYLGLAGLALAVGVGIWWRHHTRETVAKTEVHPQPRSQSSASLSGTSAPPRMAPSILTTAARLTAAALTNVPAAASVFPRPVQDVFEAQVAMERRGICSGSLDGVLGTQTHAALEVFQEREHLAVTSELDVATQAKLILESAPTNTYTITENDLARLHPVPRTWLGKSQAVRLDYETLLELVAEKGHAAPSLIRRLNPDVDWSKVTAGCPVRIPAVSAPHPKAPAAFLRIYLSRKALEAFDAATNLLVHFPCSIARSVQKRPIGQLRVTQILHYPSYVFKPEIFPESEEGRELGRQLVLPPGPNNPVGVAWIGLNRPGYGIHGTPHPESVGRTESHGCFRLANWNAEYLTELVSVGTPVQVRP